ncbi:hypothetical protein AURDEDRAFT_175268 [Auricularia subglabra TFB-10046 SS5]|uniref:Uncharacterized protein n=1 Tax=Auricularia subglabra (strain TFB-10046 / SS5) TaxID=717982 RepID=J0WTG4_AURST|nr:hypothetical protein AURDEDRAFT_175268 [Auricularia subglabra TFB-10046 SS5]
MWNPLTDPKYKDPPHDLHEAIIHDFSGSIADLVDVTNTVDEFVKRRYIFVTDLPGYNTTFPSI